MYNMPKGIPKNGINKGWFKKGSIPWIKDKNIDNCKILRDLGKKQGRLLKKKYSSGELVIWNKDLTKETDTRVKKFGETLSKKWEEDSEYRKKQSEMFSKGAFKRFKKPEERKKRSINQSKIWQNPEYVKLQMKARNVTPNKTETKFEKYLNKILPKEYKFVGDGQLIIGGRCPDYANINGQKKLIELYGDYWHRNDDPQNKIDHYKQFGFNCLIIWEKELQDLDKVKNKVLEFNHV